jgi:predicted metal-dependent phosphoesterase TrpH
MAAVNPNLKKELTHMKVSRMVAGVALGAALVCGGLAVAQKPVDNVSAKKHPNLAAAQRLSTEAFEKVKAAQEANEWDMNGHAAKAKELLEQVNNELKLAAEAANRNHK